MIKFHRCPITRINKNQGVLWNYFRNKNNIIEHVFQLAPVLISMACSGVTLSAIFLLFYMRPCNFFDCLNVPAAVQTLITATLKISCQIDESIASYPEAYH
jgi:hypothetical protein